MEGKLVLASGNATLQLYHKVKMSWNSDVLGNE
jgi:hypothetical protein